MIEIVDTDEAESRELDVHDAAASGFDVHTVGTFRCQFFLDAHAQRVDLSHALAIQPAAVHQLVDDTLDAARELRTTIDHTRPDVRLVNRNPGSGTRIWLDRSLRAHGIYPEDLRGYENEVRTHTLLAQAIQAGKADAGLGVRAAANQLGLGFTTLFEERFDLIVPPGQLEAANLRPLFDLLASGDFRRLIAALPGYRTDQTGSQINP